MCIRDRAGNGHFILKCAEEHNIPLHGISLSEEQTKVAKEKQQELNLGNADIKFEIKYPGCLIDNQTNKVNVLNDDLTEILINKGPLLSYKINFVPEILIMKIEKKPEFIKTFKTGLIESSIYLAGLKNDIPESVIMDLAYIFGWDIDFVFDIRAGDRFKILYETPYVDGQQIENVSILIAEFYNKNNRYSAIRYKGRNKKWEYFNEDGRSLEKAFLRAPLDFAYVSSHFNPNRRHPILNTIRAHNGVDYAAKRGTPIRSTGEGVIQSVGWKSGYGRTIVIRHGGEITTLYAHLDKYRAGISKGVKVSQGQTIGYVGDSGLATAPHLHYEFRIGEKRTDPLKVALPSASPIDKSEMDQFCLLYTSPSPRDLSTSRMPSSA